MTRLARPSARAAARTAPWRWAFVGAACGVILALVLYAPARWLAVTVTWASQGHVALEDAQGTVWSGSAQWVLAGGRGSRDAVALPSRLAWTLRPTLGGLALAVQAPCCTLQPIDMQLRPTPQGLTVTLADVAATHWPAQLLAGLGTPWNTLQLEGQLQLAAQGLQLQWTAGRLQVQGRAELLALNMGSRLTTLRPMGSYRLALEGGAVATLRLETLEGGLRLAGTGEWRASGLHFSGVATTAPQHAAVLANLLNLIGRREGDRSIITLG